MPHRVVTFLAPNMLPVYRAIVDYLGRALGQPMQIAEGASYAQLAEADFSFLCGLPYVLRTPPRAAPGLAALAAPVLIGERYGSRPIYFSDVIVRRDSPIRSLADLRGRSWAYNEPESQSGYGITRYWLARQGETGGFFSAVIEAGFHQRAIRMVRDGSVDAAAIDSQVLAVELRDHPRLADDLRIVGALGPSTIQPFVAAGHIAPGLQDQVRAALAAMHHDPALAETLRQGFIERFVPVTDTDYDDIRAMLDTCEAAGFLTLR